LVRALPEGTIMKDDQPRAARMGGVHHTAFRCRDAEQTRWFYEDVLGLKAVAGIVLDVVPGTNADTPYMHIFFELGDGNYIAFFDSPTDAQPDWFARKSSFDMHIAIQARSKPGMLAMQRRIESCGVRCFGPIEHGFVESIYMYDPNGIQVEITIRTAQHDRIMRDEEAALPETLRKWNERMRTLKEAKFGAQAIDRRGSDRVAAGAPPA